MKHTQDIKYQPRIYLPLAVIYFSVANFSDNFIITFKRSSNEVKTKLNNFISFLARRFIFGKFDLILFSSVAGSLFAGVHPDIKGLFS